MKRNVVELIRVSTKEQAGGDHASIPAQVSANQRTAAQHGLAITRSIQYSDVSGASVLAAPEIQELIRLMHSPDIHGVVTREFSRLMRPENLSDYALLQEFVDTGTVLYLPDGPIDFRNKQGRFLGTIRAAIAGMEREEILERVWTAKEEKRRRGELAQSQIVLPRFVGYEKGKGWFYKPEAERVRQAIRMFLAGEQNYSKLAEIVGVTPRGMHVMLRNPIWTGVRVIDKKRDKSAAGRYTRPNGRQGDRRKIARSPDEIIRVKVIEEPLISEAEFRALQQIMDLKQKRHWRSQSNYEHRFTYSGHLTCSRCGNLVHTALARRDYYACKGRRMAHTCNTRYMARERLEGVLDGLFSERLTTPSFLKRCVDELTNRSEGKETVVKAERLTSELASLRRKRNRVIESFLDEVLSREERDERLASIDRDIQIAQEMLDQERPPAQLDPKLLAEALSPLAEWRYWSREQKRNLLATLVPDIRVADYEIQSLGLSLTIFSNEDTRRDRGSSPRPA